MANRKRGKKQKTSLVFDPIARRQFLGGFQKRKQERRAKAQEELQKKLKEERQKIKLEAKESYKKMVLSHRGVPEVEHLLEEEHETDNATVKIVELSSNDLAKQNNWIGTNTAQYGKSQEEEEKEEDDISGLEESDSEEIPGMSLKEKIEPQKILKAKSKVNGEQEKVFKSAKDIKKIIKKESTKAVKKSKVFQLKNKLERNKSVKKSKIQKKLRIKAHEKRDKKRKRGGRSRNQE